MQTVAQARIVRDLDHSLTVYGEDKAIHILPSQENASSDVNNPLAHILKPDQIDMFALKKFPVAQNSFDSIYDPLHERLKVLISERDLDGAMKLAQTVGTAPDNCKTRGQMSLRDRCVAFFSRRAQTANAAETARFINRLSADSLADYLSSSSERIDHLKAEILARTVLGTLKDGDQSPIARLRAELGLVAVTAVAGKKHKASKKGTAGADKECPSLSFDTERLTKQHSFTKHILTAGISLPGFAFDTDPCDSGRNTDPSMPLSERLKKIEQKQAFNARVAAAESLKTKHTPVTHGDDAQQSSASAGHVDASDPCDCDCDDAPCFPVDPCCVDIKYYLSDLLELREETHCYEAGDLAYIENIAPHEKRVRTHTFRKQIEDYTESETTESRSEERDHSVTDRNQVSSEISKQVKASLDVEAKVTGAYTGGTYTITSNAHLSREVAQREGREHFREMVSKAVMKIQSETRKLSTRRVTTESTEVNKHVFDNSDGDTGALAKYFYVNQVKKGQVFSHGLRLMLDILIPSPAALFHELEDRKSKQASGLDEPKRPNLSPSDFDPNVFPGYDGKGPEGTRTYRNLWEHLMEIYEISDFPEPPPDMMPSRGPIATGGMVGGESKSISIPAGYRATKVSYADSWIEKEKGVTGQGNKLRMFMSAQGKQITKYNKDSYASPASIDVNATGSLKITVSGHWMSDRSYMSGMVHLEPIQYDYQAWQEEAYATVMAKYESDMEEYQRLLAEHNMRFREERKLMPPFVAEEHIRTQMKQASIFMMCDDFGDEVMNMKTEPCGYPTMFREKSKTATNRWYFFDRAFDWKQAEYIFFDYFRNPICQWHDRYDIDEPNFMLKAFKQAGYARVQIPCAPGMEDDVLKYLQTGEIWNGDDFDVIDASDPRYLAVATELKHSYDCNQNDRQGEVHVTQGDTNIEVHCSEFYLMSGTTGSNGIVDPDIIALDMDREIYIAGIAYRITDVKPKFLPGDAGFDPDCWTWVITLERPYEGATNTTLKHAVGAKFVGDNFYFKLPTDMVWLGDLFKQDGSPNTCLPCYPVNCQGGGRDD